jgi:hypothetical protein
MWSDRLIHRIGRRGAILLLFAVVDFSYGASLIVPSADSLSLESTIWRQHYAPVWVWGAGWLIVSAILAVGAFMRNDDLAYAAAIGWKIIWALTTLASWVFGGVERGWVSTFIWGVVAGIVAVDSGRGEVPRRPEPATEG